LDIQDNIIMQTGRGLAHKLRTTSLVAFRMAHNFLLYCQIIAFERGLQTPKVFPAKRFGPGDEASEP
jgi:hypothetical protein